MQLRYVIICTIYRDNNVVHTGAVVFSKRVRARYLDLSALQKERTNVKRKYKLYCWLNF